MKKIVFWISLMLLATTLLTACGDAAVTPSADTTTAQNESIDTPADTTETPVTEDPNAPRVIFDGQSCDYIIYRSEYCGELVTDASVALRNALRDNISENATKLVSLKTDFDKAAGREGIIENDEKEIQDRFYKNLEFL